MKGVLLGMMVSGLLLTVLAGTSMGNIYTVGAVEGTNSWLETWDINFNTRLDIGDVGTAKASNFGSPQTAIGVGDINTGNSGDEFVLGRYDGLGVVIKKDTSAPRLGGALFFRSNPSAASHCENTKIQMITVTDFSIGDAGKEIVTFANNGVMEVWKYRQSDGTIESRLYAQQWTSVSAGERAEGSGYNPSNRAFDGVALGEFNTSSTGLEMALLRPDGLVEIWSAYTTGIFPSTTPARLGIFSLTTLSLHDPWNNFFSGDLDPLTPGDEIGTIGSDGYYEIYNPATGLRISAPNNAYTKSAHDPFLAVTADSVVPEPITLVLLCLGGLLMGRDVKRSS